MAADSTTLYKLMILYMLNKVNFPLTNTQISDFMLGKDYTNYFTIQESLNDLLELQYIRTENYRNTTHYRITRSGSSTVSLLDDQIPSAIKEDIMDFLRSKKYELKNEVGTTATYYRNPSKDYTVHCQVKEGQSNLIELSLNIPTEEQADMMCSNWKECSQEIYEFIVKKLLQ
ncbi:MAG: DUF4364 family protein [Lachnospiraceae bacterium]